MKLTIVSTLAALLLLLQPPPSFAIDTKSGEPHSLNDYIRYALNHSASLKGAFEGYSAALQKNPQVTALPDPKLAYGYFISPIETRVGPQEHKIGVAQSFPWFGTLSLKGDMATAEAKAEFNRFLSMKNKLVFQVTKAYAELAIR